jgi:hypothetical protein
MHRRSERNEKLFVAESRSRDGSTMLAPQPWGCGANVRPSSRGAQRPASFFERSLLPPLASQVNIFPPIRVADRPRRIAEESSRQDRRELGRQICLRESIPALLAPSISRVGQQYVIPAHQPSIGTLCLGPQGNVLQIRITPSPHWQVSHRSAPRARRFLVRPGRDRIAD